MRMMPAVLLAALAIGGCSRSAPPVLRSPDGTLTLRTSIEESRQDAAAYGCVILEIADRDGKLLYRENSRASEFQRWDVAWVSSDKIRLDSADRGTYYWKRQADGTWRKQLE